MMKIAIFCIVALVSCVNVVRSCTTTADCGADECCYTSNRPIGKRQLHFGGNTCQPRGASGSGCLVSQSVYDPTRVYFSCPCQDGLTCSGTGLFDVPLGETGVCK